MRVAGGIEVSDTPDTTEIAPVDNGCINGCSAPFGVRCSVCNTEKRQPSSILCQCANHHLWFGWPNVVNVCLTCSGAAVNEYVMHIVGVDCSNCGRSHPVDTLCQSSSPTAAIMDQLVVDE